MMVVTQFYLDIMTRLRQNILDDVGAPHIRHFDLWNGQTDQQEEEDNDELPFSTPAVFLELLPAEPITLGKRKQICEQSFQLHVACEIYGEHSSGEEESIRNNSLHHLELLNEIFESLQNYSGPYFNSINRVGFPLFDHEHTQVYKHTMVFKTLITDVAAMRATVHITPNLKVIQKQNP